MIKIKGNVTGKKHRVKKNISKAVKKRSIDKISPMLINKIESSTIKMDQVIVKTDTIKKKKQGYILPSQYITEEFLNMCLDALEKMTIHYKKNNKIFEEETPVFAEINCIKIQNKKGKILFTLPHTTFASTAEVCLITPDLKKGKKVDHEPTIDYWEDILRKANVTAVKTVLPMRQLRVEYDQFELKRRLLTQHDFIMVDTRVLNHVTHVLGKMFFKRHNMLIPVRLNEKKDVKKCIDNGLHTAILRLSEGATSTILIGHTGMARKGIKENIMSLLEQLQVKFPGGEANIRSIAIKLPVSLSIPLYITLRPTKSVKAPKLLRTRPKMYRDVEGELSTIPGATVKVTADGTVHFKRNEQYTDMSGSDIDDIGEESIDESGEKSE